MRKISFTLFPILLIILLSFACCDKSKNEETVYKEKDTSDDVLSKPEDSLAAGEVKAQALKELNLARKNLRVYLRELKEKDPKVERALKASQEHTLAQESYVEEWIMASGVKPAKKACQTYIDGKAELRRMKLEIEEKLSKSSGEERERLLYQSAEIDRKYDRALLDLELMIGRLRRMSEVDSNVKEKIEEYFQTKDDLYRESLEVAKETGPEGKELFEKYENAMQRYEQSRIETKPEL